MKVKRNIIEIDERLCDGCGDCLTSCPEQAIRLVDTPEGKKARLVKEIYCDGLGACLGACHTGALTVEEREVDAYDEEATLARIREVAPEMMETHLQHMREHGMAAPTSGGLPMFEAAPSCPSARLSLWAASGESGDAAPRGASQLRQWPVQLNLIPPFAPFLKNADLLLAADCVPFAYPNFHQDFLKDKVLAVGCPKLDDVDAYIDKVTEIIRTADLKRIQIAYMEVPCCAGLVYIVQKAMAAAGRSVPVETVVVGVQGGLREP